MTRSFLFVFSLLLFIAPAHAQKPKKALLVIVDGIPADVIESLAPPNLQKIALAGGYSHSYVGGHTGTYTETPTISAVGYNTILTGVWANKHNVWGNGIKAPNYHYPTLFRLLKEQYPGKTTAVFSTWLDNRTKLVGDRLAATGNFAVDYKYDSLELDKSRFPHDKEDHYIDHIDDSVATYAAHMIRKVAPDFSWVYLQYSDDMGHAFGDSPQFHEAIGKEDERIGKLWEAVQYRQQQFGEDWLLIVTTDHGRDPATGKGHGGQTDRERASWIFTNASDRNQEFVGAETSAVDILPTFARFLGITIPEETARELDGTALIGDLSFTNAQFNVESKTLHILWKPEGSDEKLKIYAATTDHYKTGGTDDYQLISTVSSGVGKTSVSLDAFPGPVLKIMLEGAHNRANYLIVDK